MPPETKETDRGESVDQPKHSPSARPLSYEQIHQGSERRDAQSASPTDQQRILGLAERSGAYGTPGYRDHGGAGPSSSTGESISGMTSKSPGTPRSPKNSPTAC